MLSKLRRQEEGSALIFSMLAATVVVILSSLVVGLSVHNTQMSSFERRRVQSIAAAEAGVDYYLSLLTKTGGVNPPCDLTKPMREGPASFTVVATYYDAGQVALSCPLGGTLAAGSNPASVLLNSKGETSGPTTLTRTMQAYANITGEIGTTFDNDGAVIAQNSINFTANATVGGDNYSDANLYSNGSVTVASGSTIYGKIFAQGSFTIGQSSQVKKDVHTAGAITMANKSKIYGSAISSGSSITLSGTARIYNGAKAALDITGGTVDVYRNPFQVGLPAPPARSYPAFTYVEADWVAGGYSVQNFSGAGACSAAESYIRTTWASGNLLVRITEPGTVCTLTFASGTINVKGNLGIVSDGPVTLSTGARFTPSPSSSTFDVFVFTGLSGSAPCDFTANTNSGFGPGLSVLIYTPQTCTATMANNTALTQGQIIAGVVNFKHTAHFTYKRLSVPGTGTGGFQEDIVYKREIVD
jgi:hypothetical protein